MQMLMRKRDGRVPVQPDERTYDQLRLPEHAVYIEAFRGGYLRGNIRSRNIAKNNTSGVRGVYKSERSGKWCAQITFQGKTRYLGSYATLEEASEARKKGEALFDEFLARYDASRKDEKMPATVPQDVIKDETLRIIRTVRREAVQGA